MVAILDIKREKIESGFEPRTSRSLAWHSNSRENLEFGPGFVPRTFIFLACRFIVHKYQPKCVSSIISRLYGQRAYSMQETREKNISQASMTFMEYFTTTTVG